MQKLLSWGYVIFCSVTRLHWEWTLRATHLNQFRLTACKYLFLLISPPLCLYIKSCNANCQQRHLCVVNAGFHVSPWVKIWFLHSPSQVTRFDAGFYVQSQWSINSLQKHVFSHNWQVVHNWIWQWCHIFWVSFVVYFSYSYVLWFLLQTKQNI